MVKNSALRQLNDELHALVRHAREVKDRARALADLVRMGATFGPTAHTTTWLGELSADVDRATGDLAKCRQSIIYAVQQVVKNQPAAAAPPGPAVPGN